MAVVSVVVDRFIVETDFLLLLQHLRTRKRWMVNETANRESRLIDDSSKMDCMSRLVVFSIVIISNQCKAVNTENECSNATKLDTRDRSLWYSNYNDIKCDLGLQDGWYRFTGRAGAQMATTCVSTHHCGTQYPGWLLGSHPAATDGRVNKTVCFTKDSNCCHWSTNITVRNCSGFYVYEFKKNPNLCPYRFCGQEDIDCHDKSGNAYTQGEVFNPNRLQKCICHQGNNITCSNLGNGCWDDGIAHASQDVWLLRDRMTVCRCSSNQALCVNHSGPVCLDDKKLVRKNGSTWFMSNCTNCTCVEGKVVCTQHDIKAFYGRTVVKIQSCYLEEKPVCLNRNETIIKRRDCKIYFTNVQKNYFWCDNQIEVIPKTHKCNAVVDCTDGSDEKNCENDVCSDGNGKMVIIRTESHNSLCIRCICNNSFLFCEKHLRVLFPAFGNKYAWKRLTCDARTCNVTTFFHKPFDCKAIEFLPKANGEMGKTKMIGHVWSYRGCKFTFTGTIYDKRCPAMPNGYCYVYNGGICCAAKCTALKAIGEELRQHQGFQLCPSGFQLVSKGQSECVDNLQRHLTVTTCLDVNGNKYFEGAKWNIGSCIDCKCSYGLLDCHNIQSKISCKQPHCDIWEYTNIKKTSKCLEVCEWGGKQIPKVSTVKSKGVDFTCGELLHYTGRCFFRRQYLKCTGSFPGIMNSSLVPSDLYFLCSSGDQVIGKDRVCDGGSDCYDKSDEIFCEAINCQNLKMGNKVWSKVPVSTEIKKNCSSINSTWSGIFNAKCEQLFGFRSSWKTQCLCEDVTLRGDLRLKLSNISELSVALQNFMQELIERSAEFTNKRVLIHYLTLVANEMQRRYSPITADNDNEAAHLAKVLCNSIRDLNMNKTEGFFYNYCGSQSAKDQAKEIFNLNRDIIKFLKTAPRNSKCYNQSIELEFKTRTDNNVARNLRGILQKNKWQHSAVELRDFVTNGSNKDIMMNKEFLKNCSKDFSRDLLNQSVSRTARRISARPVLSKTQIYLELSLMILGTVAMSITIVILYRVKVKSQRNAEKLYVHRSLMISLILANLVYMADVFFAKRNEYQILCTLLAVVQHYFHTAVFSWMLCEGLHLYFMLVKVFVLTKLSLIHCFIGWGWNKEKAFKTSLEAMSYEELDQKLGQFYVEARNKNGESYSRASLLSLRNGIERYLTSPPHSRPIKLNKDPRFVLSNKVLDASIKQLKKDGKGNTTHKPPIEQQDMEKLKNSNVLLPSNPQSLLNNVWFHVSLYWCRRGREGQRSLTTSSFTFEKDGDEKEYVTMTHDESTKNHPGGLNDVQSFEKYGMMYKTETPTDGYSSLQFYLSKVNPACTALFQYPKRNWRPTDSVWYENRPLGANKLSKMMSTISEGARLSKIYTNHSVRATAITLWSRAGLPDRQIMAISGHRSESSLKSYHSRPSSLQLRECSDVLSSAIGERINTTLQSRNPCTSTVRWKNSRQESIGEERSGMFASCTFHGNMQINHYYSRSYFTS